MPQGTSIRERDAKTVKRAVREKGRRTYASAELDEIKRQMIAKATAANVSTLKIVHPRTGERIVLSRQRSGAPVDESRIGDVTELLKPEVADTLFPPVVRRSFDWDAIGEFLAREHPKKSKAALAQRRLVEIIEQDASWTLKVFDAETVWCVECAEELTQPKGGINLCDAHRKWYKVPSFMRDLGKDEPKVADVGRFNDERRKTYRAKWLRNDAEVIAAWDVNNTRKGRKAIAEQREAKIAAQRN